MASRRCGPAVQCASPRAADGLHVVIEDSGIGFDPTAARTGSGVGLRSVAERLRAHCDEASLHPQRHWKGASIRSISRSEDPQLRRRVG
jgi:signal transduction histidine kinase